MYLNSKYKLRFIMGLTEAEYQVMMVGLEKMYVIFKKERKESFLGVLNEKKRKSN